MRKKVELLEYHAHFAGYAAHVIVFYVFRTAGGFTAQLLTVDGDAALIDCFQLVEAAQQCALAAAGGTDNGNNLAFVYFKIDALEYFQVIEFFPDIGCFDFSCHGGYSSYWSYLEKRFSRRSKTRVKIRVASR